jgi:hypothetical protein
MLQYDMIVKYTFQQQQHRSVLYTVAPDSAMRYHTKHMTDMLGGIAARMKLSLGLIN